VATAVRLPPRVEFAIVRALCALPRPLRRIVAGPPVQIDGQALHSEMGVILRAARLIGETSLTGYGTVEAARARYSGWSASGAGPPLPLARVERLEIPGPAGPMAARLYDRDGAPTDSAPRPLLVYIHGGGWVIGDLDTHDSLCRFLAAASGVPVIAPAYGLAPERPYPGPVQDARAAYDWVAANAEALRVDPARIAIGGDSAGGNMATVICRQLRDEGGPAPAMQLLLYPIADDVETWASREAFGEGLLLTARDMDWFREHYLSDPETIAQPDVSPFQAEDLSGLAPVYIATAGFDVLRDEGEAYARKLRDHGTTVAHRRHPGLVHGFGQMTEVSRTARAAMFEAAGALRMALA
jgi:acetyl esterase